MGHETNKSLGLALKVAAIMKQDERFDEVVPIIPVITGVMRKGEPKYITVTAVGAEGDDLYVMPLSKELAKEMADQFYGYIKRLEEEEGEC